MTSQTNDFFVYVGTYTRTDSEGIYVYRMDAGTGALSYVTYVASEEPTFLAFDPDQNFLYAVNEVPEFQGRSSGAVSAFAVDKDSGRLSFVNQQPTNGPGPCHVTVDATGQYAIVANYLGGSIAVLPIQEDGSLGEVCDFIQHEGSSVNPDRQQEPHAHSVNIDSGNRYAFAADLGIDKMMVYELDLEQGKLIPNSTPSTSVKAGAGPRHFTFHPSDRFAYLINELDSTITAFACDLAQGTLTEIETVPTLPPDFSGRSTCADIHTDLSGKFLYGSNRGHDSIVIYAIDQESGRLTYVGHEPTQGSTPRNFAIDPTGTFLLAANQNGNSIVTFRVDGDTGKLTPTGDVTNVPMPVCIKFLPA